eukprot:UN26292
MGGVFYYCLREPEETNGGGRAQKNMDPPIDKRKNSINTLSELSRIDTIDMTHNEQIVTDNKSDTEHSVDVKSNHSDSINVDDDKLYEFRYGVRSFDFFEKDIQIQCEVLDPLG